MNPRPKLLRVLSGETLERPLIWFMHQAGRSLPEYRALREKSPDFIASCLDPDGDGLDRRVDALVCQWGGGAYVFNLGHGVLPDTPIQNIARVAERVTGT